MIRLCLRMILLWILKEPEIKWGKIGNDSHVYEPCTHDENTGLVEIGNNTQILANSRIQLYPSLVDNIPHIRIGNGCYLGYYLSLLAGEDIVIEDNVLMASGVLISSENHSIDPESNIPYMDQRLKAKPVRIGEGSWLGEKVMVMPGVTIGKKCVIGAGAIVTKDIPDYSIAVGNPAKVIKRYDFKEHEWVEI